MHRVSRVDEKERLNGLTHQIIGAAIDVHRELGPGLLESAYQTCLTLALSRRKLALECQKRLPLTYDGVSIDCAYRVDLLVERQVVVEIKAVEKLLPVHEAQLRLYLRLLPCKVGLLINFNVKWLSDQGIKRIVNEFPD